MPAHIYCLDNFFHKMTDLESPRKNNDCYFYYYSTCIKGDNCTFRHEPSALGCETTCTFWKEGKCVNVHCNFRHMELRKNRKAIQCYWETQPGGCLKSHCPFLHQNSNKNVESSTTINKDQDKLAIPESCSKKSNQSEYGSPAVDPLVVNFEEESDNESAPTQSPEKWNQRHASAVKVKTLEEIRLDRIQAESAAYYSYPVNNLLSDEIKDLDGSDHIRSRILSRFSLSHKNKESTNIELISEELSARSDDFKILTLAEIRSRKRNADTSSNVESVVPNVESSTKRRKVELKRQERHSLSDAKIYTLAEIKAMKAMKQHFAPSVSEQEVSSTSKFEDTEVNVELERIKNEPECKDDLYKEEFTTQSSETMVQKENMLDLDENIQEVNQDSRHIEELLLEDDDMESAPISIKDEDDILKDIDDMLNDS